MREIKFRAWDVDFKEMIKSWSIVSHNKGYILMQFTGLKDKSGKEIYENDIVEFTRQEGELAVFRRYTCKVVFENGMFILGCNELEDSYITFIDLYDFELEVIGNIYENPELIK